MIRIGTQSNRKCNFWHSSQLLPAGHQHGQAWVIYPSLSGCNSLEAAKWRIFQHGKLRLEMVLNFRNGKKNTRFLHEFCRFGRLMQWQQIWENQWLSVRRWNGLIRLYIYIYTYDIYIYMIYIHKANHDRLWVLTIRHNEASLFGPLKDQLL